MNKIRAMILFAMFVLPLSVLSVGCGPVVSGKNIIDANIAISAAKTAGAEKQSIYEYTAAKEYLQKAREEHGYSDFWAAGIYADKALEYAKQARRKAEATSDAGGPAPFSGGPAPLITP